VKKPFNVHFDIRCTSGNKVNFFSFFSLIPLLFFFYFISKSPLYWKLNGVIGSMRGKIKNTGVRGTRAHALHRGSRAAYLLATPACPLETVFYNGPVVENVCHLHTTASVKTYISTFCKHGPRIRHVQLRIVGKFYYTLAVCHETAASFD
jgi:hypothetical protein